MAVGEEIVGIEERRNVTVEPEIEREQLFDQRPRLVGVGILDIEDGPAAPDGLGRAVDHRGFHAFHVYFHEMAVHQAKRVDGHDVDDFARP